MTEENKIRDAADAVKGIVEAVPIYEDVLQPAAKEVGAALQTVAKTVHVLLGPVSALVWSYDKIKNFIETSVAEKLSEIPAENIVPPKPEVAVPALESLRYTGHNEELRELYANLLATSMDKNTATKAHPGFVEIIRNISPDEARIMKLFSKRLQYPIIDVRSKHPEKTEQYTTAVANYSHLGKNANCEHLHLAQPYTDNLCRLKLLTLDESASMTVDGIYDPLENDSDLDSAKLKIENEGRIVDFDRKIIKRTSWGLLFINACIRNKAVKADD